MCSYLNFFENHIDNNLLLNSIYEDNEAQIQNYKRIQNILKWIFTAPEISSYRVNTLLYSTQQIEDIFKTEILKLAESRCFLPPSIEICEYLPETIILHNWNVKNLDLVRKEKEIIVDRFCGASVLRGAHIFAPGVIGMISGSKTGDKVSIYVDTSGKCKKGFNKLYECPEKIFIGNGTLKMSRYHLFDENKNPSGIAVEVTDTLSGCLPLNEESFLPKNSFVLQNIPSIICVHVFNPSPNDIILDMCASPGNKTTHIAALTENKSTLIAIDKTPSKIDRLKLNCKNLNAKVHIFQADSTKILDDTNLERNVISGPPFPSNSFDKILLDAPCSALGKRPQFSLKINKKVLNSFVPLQKKLFQVAVNLLKSGGTLVYSTCTITITENEDIVAWALKKFPFLVLNEPKIKAGSSGYFVPGLTDEQRSFVQRFDSESDVDSVGFFIASFTKK